MINREKRSKALSEVKPVQRCATQRMCVCVWGGRGDFWNLSVFLTKFVDTISGPNVVNKFGVFFGKKKEIHNSIIIQSPRNETVNSVDD